MERFYPFFGHTLKRDIDLLRFLYLQKRFVPIEEISQSLALDRRSIQKSFDTLSKRSLSLQDTAWGYPLLGRSETTSD